MRVTKRVWRDGLDDFHDHGPAASCARESERCRAPPAASRLSGMSDHHCGVRGARSAIERVDIGRRAARWWRRAWRRVADRAAASRRGRRRLTRPTRARPSQQREPSWLPPGVGPACGGRLWRGARGRRWRRARSAAGSCASRPATRAVSRTEPGLHRAGALPRQPHADAARASILVLARPRDVAERRQPLDRRGHRGGRRRRGAAPAPPRASDPRSLRCARMLDSCDVSVPLRSSGGGDAAY